MQVYRFRDKVAFNPPGAAETVYFSADVAEQMAEAITAVVADIRAREFSASQVGTRRIHVEEG